MKNVDLSTRRGFEPVPDTDGKVSGSWGGIYCVLVCKGCPAVWSMIERNDAVSPREAEPYKFASLTEYTQDMVSQASGIIASDEEGTFYGQDCPKPARALFSLGKAGCRAEFYLEG